MSPQIEALPVVAPPPVLAVLRQALPGLALAVGLAAGAMAVRRLPGLGAISPAILAVVLGMAARRVIGLQASLRPGLALSTRTLLRLAVVLLGLQIPLGQIAALGIGSLLAVMGGLFTCFFGTIWLGRRLGVDSRLTRLIATGTAVCGASAVVAANSVSRGSDEDVAYALATVTLFGTLAMLVVPALALLLGLDPELAGIWTGASIHEVAQVVGAATQLGSQATQTATIAKMARVLMLAPLVLAMLAHERRRRGAPDAPEARLPVPWFVFGFLALAGVASLGVVPVAVAQTSGLVASFLLAAALAAMGFAVELRALRKKGLRPLLLALSSALLIAGTSYGLLQLLR